MDQRSYIHTYIHTGTKETFIMHNIDHAKQTYMQGSEGLYIHTYIHTYIQGSEGLP